MKKISIYSLLFFLSIILIGCPKIVRDKSKKKNDAPVYIFDDRYDQLELNEEVFKKNFIYWKTSHDELRENLFDLKKRRQAAFDCIINYLERLKNTLPLEKQKDVNNFLNRYKLLEPAIIKDSISRNSQEFLKKKLDVLRCDVMKQIAPDKKEIQEIFQNKNTAEDLQK
jgi:hypothetical protein